MGPLVTRAHRDKVKGYVDLGAKEGAKLVVDGRGLVVKGHEDGFFLGTTLFDHVTPQMTIYQDEIFGPVLIVLRVATLEDAIALVNANPYANGTAIFTESGGAARRFENEIQVGMVGRQCADPGAGRVLLVRRVEGLALRRPPCARRRRRQVLHPHQSGDHPVAAPGHPGARPKHADAGLNRP